MYLSKLDCCHMPKADEADQEQKLVFCERSVLTFIHLMNTENRILNDAISPEMPITIYFRMIGIAC